MESTTSSPEVLVCQTCGAEGFTNAFIYCVKCLEFVVHRYCLDIIPKASDEFVTWFCEDCKPPFPHNFTLTPKHVPTPSHKEDPANSALVKTTHPKKKQKRKQKKKPVKKRKIVSVVAEKDNECVSVPNQITHRAIVLALFAKHDCHEQSSESTPVNNRSPLEVNPLPKHENLQSQKENATHSSHVKTTKRKKKPKRKQKKRRKIVALVNRPEDSPTKPNDKCVPPTRPNHECASPTKPNHECASPTKPNDKCVPPTRPNHECASPTKPPIKESLVKSDSGPNQITPPVAKGVLEKHSTESTELDRRRPDETCVDAKTKGLKTKKTTTSVEHSSCESSCTDVTLKVKEEKSVSKSIELNKKSKQYDGQFETENMIHNKDDMRVNTGASVSQSAHLENNSLYMHYPHARPVLDPVWRGSFSITETDYDMFEGFVGHLSNKACQKVCEVATTLPSLLSLEMRTKSELWPKSFLESQPSDESIALYFFPGDAKNERVFEQLVNDMIEEELALKATTKNAELLIFTSNVLPRSFWRFQGHYYLWGVFRGKRNDDHDHAVSNNSNNKVTSEKEILTRVKDIESHSPQSPLCNYR